MMARAAACTILSQEMIKPSSPTPSHLRTYNLSEIDQRLLHFYLPLILYYPNNEVYSLTTPDDKVRVLKKSLSQSLTRYYPFAGRIHTPMSPNIDCNDEGAVFVEAKHESQMNMLQLTSDDDTFAQLFVDGMFWVKSPKGATLLGVQVNHFACGGVAVAVSLSHKISDGCTLGSFVSHWASVARYGSTDHKEVLPLNPHFVQHPAITTVSPEMSPLRPNGCNVVTRRFLFPNSKLSDLKNKVFSLAGGESINNPTRVEVLASLLYKTAVATITPSSLPSFKPSFLIFPANIRSKFVPKLPNTTFGNFVASMFIKTRDESETSLSVLVSKIKKQKIELDRLQNVQLAIEWSDLFGSSIGNEDLENVANRSFLITSLCGLGYNKVDFGWGNPAVSSMTSLRAGNQVGSYMMDTPNGDGIAAWVTLEPQHMERFQNDKELLSFSQN